MHRYFPALLALIALFPATEIRAQEQRALIGQSWLTENGKARVQFSPCPASGGKLCGTIVWLAEPLDKKTGQPRIDALNKNAKEKGRPVMGLPLVEGFSWRNDAWRGGTIYDPESGERYNATLEMDGRLSLKVTGCVLFLCKVQHWSDARKGK